VTSLLKRGEPRLEMLACPDQFYRRRVQAHLGSEREVKERMSYADRRRFYSEPFLSPKTESQFLEFGMLPSLHGLCEFEGAEPSVDAVFLSHSHGDHSGCISFLNRRRIAPQKLHASLSYLEVSSSGVFQQPGLCEIGSSPANSIVENSLLRTRKKLRPFSFSQAEQVGQVSNSVTSSMRVW
jgi:Cft2 family RNA processing exonuclease